MIAKRSALPARISSKFAVMGGCWVWLACKDRHGYGRVWFNGETRSAYRVVYELCVDSIPEGLTLDHLCRNPSCVNPSHLEPVTNKVNVLRGQGITAKAARKTHCAHGHEFTDANTLHISGARVCRQCNRARNRRVPKEVRSEYNRRDHAKRKARKDLAELLAAKEGA